MSEPSPRERPARGAFPRGGLVEFVRLIFVALSTYLGYYLATNLGPDRPEKTILGVVLGSAVGYVIGGIFGRQTATAVSSVEREFRKTPAAEIVAGAIGLVLGLFISFLLTFPLFRLPPEAAWPTVAFVYLTLPYVSYRIGRSKRDEFFALIGLKPRAAGAAPGSVSVIDTSALIDGRMMGLVEEGFISGTLLVHAGVLEELQRIADSSDPRRRTRGRRGLDNVARLQRAPTVEVHLVEGDAGPDVDGALVRLARERGGALVTGDANLAKLATALSVPVRSINAVAAVFRAPVSPGEEIRVRLTREGREHGQGVGFLDDGTMVVVEEGAPRVGQDVEIRVTNVLQTATGRMVFASLADRPTAPS
ncbi:MAG: TRAM domain-containing protein [Actinobacteria bacterium]|nr:TRAM domain-containing protein [Actinomycetota bacterium]